MKDYFDINSDNFDTEGITEKTPEIPQRSNDDYGDDFESQTGENTAEYQGRADYSDNFSEYKGNRQKTKRTKNGSMQNEKALIFAAAVVIGLIAGVLIFTLMQCSNSNTTQTTTIPTTLAVTTPKQTEYEQPYEEEETTLYYEPETTEEPTEAPTTEYIEETTEYVEETTQSFTEEYTESETNYEEETTDEVIVPETEETTKQIV